MKEITREQIDQAVEEASKKLLMNTKDQFLELCKEIPEDMKDNPLAYHTLSVVTAQYNAINVIEDVLCKLLT